MTFFTNTGSFGKHLLSGLSTISLLITQFSLPQLLQRTNTVVSSRKFDVHTQLIGYAHVARTGIGTSSPAPSSIYSFGNPAGCSVSAPVGSVEERLSAIQVHLGDSLDLEQSRQFYIWNGPANTMMNVSDDTFAFEFIVNEFQPPYMYKADEVATIFLNNGFVIWFRSYGGSFRLLAVPVMEGVYESKWGEYVRSYWQKDGVPQDDTIHPVTKKLPCHWAVDGGFVTDQQLRHTFDFDWNMPPYAEEGRKYLASTCREAYRVSQEEIGYWDATSMCGPLAWRIVKDANGFPYRIGDWYSDATLFTLANPRWNGRPWIGFDPETYDLIRVDSPMMRYDFAELGNLYTGDIVYSFSTLYDKNDGRFDHIFMVTGIDADGSRSTISNMVQNSPNADCFIREVTLYTPGDLETGVINYEWNNHGYGSTGSTGFDVMRWKWVTYHVDGKPIQYTVRWGDTIETIAFDWKVSPESILDANLLHEDVQLSPGQVLTLPATTAQ